jgi:hypothetical protein
MSREQAIKAANLIADDFKVGFCDSKMVELFADRIEEVYGDAMNLRDFFATKALMGLLTVGDYDNFTVNAIAKHSYVVADAMLKARGNL